MGELTFVFAPQDDGRHPRMTPADGFQGGQGFLPVLLEAGDHQAGITGAAPPSAPPRRCWW